MQRDRESYFMSEVRLECGMRTFTTTLKTANSDSTNILFKRFMNCKNLFPTFFEKKILKLRLTKLHVHNITTTTTLKTANSDSTNILFKKCRMNCKNLFPIFFEKILKLRLTKVHVHNEFF